MNKITNPIIPGFNPDPSIVRVGDDYYIATSTFEWFPGVQIHHSKDLKNWRLIGHALTEKRLLDMKGVPDSCGVWAPCLTYHEGTFYLVYSNVKTFDGVWKDTPNFLTTTHNIETGEWSDPIFLGSSGFDGSLFHDDDGRKWYSSLLVDHRGGKFFGGIVLQEYSEKEKKLVGPVKNIFPGSELGITEGPHIYKLKGYYYLVTAEGGTEYGHAVSIARSKNIGGSYELHPANPLITSRNNPGLYIQKSGHGDFVETQSGEWYMVHLGGRPLTKLGRCTLGRETCIQKIVWKDDLWPYLENGGNEPAKEIPAPALPEQEWTNTSSRINFNNKELDVNFSTLRIPFTEEMGSLNKREGYLRLYGQESLCSIHQQTIVARRIQAFNVEVSICLEFQPQTFQQMAGLVFYYNTMHMHYAHISFNEETNTKYLQLISADNGNFNEPLENVVEIPEEGKVYLKGHMNEDQLQFYYSLNEKAWTKLGSVLDASILSDDYVRDNGLHYRAAFTGSFVGMCCQDLSGSKKHADFDWFEYNEI